MAVCNTCAGSGRMHGGGPARCGWCSGSGNAGAGQCPYCSGSGASHSTTSTQTCQVCWGKGTVADQPANAPSIAGAKKALAERGAKFSFVGLAFAVCSVLLAIGVLEEQGIAIQTPQTIGLAFLGFFVLVYWRKLLVVVLVGLLALFTLNYFIQ